MVHQRRKTLGGKVEDVESNMQFFLHEVQVAGFPVWVPDAKKLTPSAVKAITSSMNMIWNRCRCVLITQRSPSCQEQTNLHTQINWKCKHQPKYHKGFKNFMTSVKIISTSFIVLISTFRPFIGTVPGIQGKLINWINFSLGFQYKYILLITTFPHVYFWQHIGAVGAVNG